MLSTSWSSAQHNVQAPATCQILFILCAVNTAGEETVASVAEGRAIFFSLLGGKKSGKKSGRVKEGVGRVVWKGWGNGQEGLPVKSEQDLKE